jgi:hypothetical protein
MIKKTDVVLVSVAVRPGCSRGWICPLVRHSAGPVGCCNRQLNTGRLFALPIFINWSVQTPEIPGIGKKGEKYELEL